MRSIRSFFKSHRLRKKYVFMIAVLSLFSIVTLSTYGFFVISTNGYKASELLVAELSYGINIVEDGETGSTVNNNSVTVPAFKKAYFYITISSVNKIDSKYALAYKTSSSANVQYTDRTAWGSEGLIKGYDEETYSKQIRVVVDNIAGASEAKVDFSVYGGYTFNTYAAISLGDGYYTVSGPYTELAAVVSSRLVDVVENQTSCITEDNGSCMYGGGSTSNYLQYPENADKTKNIWRIIGTYNIDDNIVAKVVSESTGETTLLDLNTGLTSFYDSLEGKDNIVFKTNKFNCVKNNCSTSSFNNIGIITTSEYETIGGNSSYLSKISPFFGLEGSTLKNITNEGINDTSDSVTSILRPSIYLQSDVKVTGSGTASDPYVVSQSSDINLVAYTLNSEATDKTYSWLLQNKVVNSVKCEKGTNASWDLATSSIKLTNVQVPDYCTIDFKDGYIVTLKANNGKITTANPLSIGYNGSVSFTVTPNTDYIIAGSTVSCGGGASATISSSGVVSVTGVKATQTCTVDMAPDKLTLYAQLLQDNKTLLARSSFDSVFTEENTGTLYKASGNETEDGSDVYYFAGKAQNNWVKFGKDQDNADLYWRIIRTNEDGSVRLLYVGPDPATTSAFIKVDGTLMSGGSNTTGMYNNNYNNTMYVGYMYGSTGSLASNRGYTTSAPIKQKTDEWYSKTLNIKTDAKGNTYDSYVSRTAIYCNDRAGDGWTASGTMYYAARKRLVDAKSPSYKCGNNASRSLFGDANVADKFSVSTSKGGNGKLQYPIAQITADEIAYAGGVYGNNAPAWYYYNSANGSAVGSDYWWTMSPYSFFGGNARVFFVYGSFNPVYLGNTFVSSSDPGVRPVVSLKSCALVSEGNGSSNTPYIIEINSTCASSEN